LPSDLKANRRRAERLLATVNLGDWSILIQDVADELDDVYGSGLTEGLRLTDMSVSTEQVNERALAWARERAASMVTMIEGNTRDMLRATVASAIEEGWSAARLADEVAESPAFNADRAMTIARTEIVAANNAGNLDGYKDARDSGVKMKKEWITAGDDLVSEGCQENEDAGPIDLDDDFPSGDDAPPAHPSCRCAVSPVVDE
jgi:hypothetical protein